MNAVDQPSIVFIHVSACNCHGHSDSCYYDSGVAERRESLDIHGQLEGGGVCQYCQHNTQGINCQECQFGYYNPTGIPFDSPWACQGKCNIIILFGEKKANKIPFTQGGDFPRKLTGGLGVFFRG